MLSACTATFFLASFLWRPQSGHQRTEAAVHRLRALEPLHATTLLAAERKRWQHAALALPQ